VGAARAGRAFVKVENAAAYPFDTGHAGGAEWAMPESSEAPPRSGRAVLIWAITATLAALVLGNTALVLWVRLREANNSSRHVIVKSVSSSRPSNTLTAEPAPGAFDHLRDSDVAGRYRFFENGVELGAITLLPSHSIINKDGTTYPRYHWEIQPDGIMTVWQRGQILLNVLEKPGVYVARKKDGTETLRIEKLPE
jgi:hypothetical protein